MDFLDELFRYESNEVMVLNKVQFSMQKRKKKLCRFLPKISSTAKASRILDAPIKPDRHAEKTDEMMPITTNGAQILIY